MKTFFPVCFAVLMFLMANPALAQNEWRDTITDVDRYQAIKKKGLYVEENIITPSNIITEDYKSAREWHSAWEAIQGGYVDLSTDQIIYGAKLFNELLAKGQAEILAPDNSAKNQNDNYRFRITEAGELQVEKRVAGVWQVCGAFNF